MGGLPYDNQFQHVVAGKRDLWRVTAFPSRPNDGYRVLRYGSQTHVMGILNITPDSFSDGGNLRDVSAVVDAAAGMVSDGEASVARYPEFFTADCHL